eukprot:366555-Chlamydomonas_euryale.AAC.20
MPSQEEVTDQGNAEVISKALSQESELQGADLRMVCLCGANADGRNQRRQEAQQSKRKTRLLGGQHPHGGTSKALQGL